MYKYDEDDSPKIVHKNEWNREVFSYCPTAEQMIGWLEEQEEILGICIIRDYGWFYQISIKNAPRNFSATFHSRREATIAAIDAALEYLENLKQ